MGVTTATSVGNACALLRSGARTRRRFLDDTGPETATGDGLSHSVGVGYSEHDTHTGQTPRAIGIEVSDGATRLATGWPAIPKF
jgi:hypothetical protein